MTRRKLATKTLLIACLAVVSYAFTIHFAIWYHRTGDLWLGAACALCWAVTLFSGLAVFYRLKKLLARDVRIVYVKVREEPAA